MGGDADLFGAGGGPGGRVVGVSETEAVVAGARTVWVVWCQYEIEQRTYIHLFYMYRSTHPLSGLSTYLSNISPNTTHSGNSATEVVAAAHRTGIPNVF